MRKIKTKKKTKASIFPIQESEFYGTKIAAALIGCSELAMRRYGYLGIIKPAKEGRKHVYRHSCLVNWLLLGRPTSIKKFLAVNSTGRVVSMTSQIHSGIK